MPRLPPQLISQARNIDPLIPLLLRSCRDLHSARNELRWLREHLSPNPNASNRQKSLRRLCIERSRGKPLQYILGDQPFGNLEILCRTGVLIPRPETETWATNLATLIPTYPPLLPHGDDAAPRALRILDLCTGTGCIALLLHSLLHRTHPSLQILGIDVSSRAIALARRNLHHNVSSNHLLHSSATEQIRFKYGDIFNNENNKAVWRGEESEGWDIVVANPPYVSPRDYNHSTARSVRNWEPRVALVPPASHSDPRVITDADEEATNAGDAFYPRVVEIAETVGAKAVVMEVGGMAQAERVATLVAEGEIWGRCEVWRDWEGGADEMMEIGGEKKKEVRVKGEGQGRVVVGWR